ncbi:ribosome rescue protein RqcH [Natronorarus salvus]|uniref:ribosome rescue protein RqcH n=1 Tax=Natronorarus salvus TaxID=3117733 RepID=UPI002F25F300
MDAKREMTSVDLAALVGELRSYTGAKVDKAYLYGDDLLRLRMRDFDRGRIELLIEVGEVKRAHLSDPENVPDAPGRPPEFAKMLRNRISGGDFAGVEQYEFDRILTFEFEREDRNTIVVAELFGQGNVAICDGTMKVLDALETVRLKSRTVAPGATYGYPDTRVSPLSIEYERFEAIMDDSDTDVVRTLATQFNLGGLYAEELCTRAGVEKTLAIAEADEEAYERVFDALARLSEQIGNREFEPRVYYEEGRRVDVTPLALSEYEDLEFESFETFTRALDDYFTNGETDEEAVEKEEGPDFRAQIERQQRIVDQQEGAIEGREEEAAKRRERAEALYANYDLANEVLTTVRNARAEDRPWDEIETTLDAGAERGIEAAEAVRGIDGESGTVTLDLGEHDVTLVVRDGVEKNADRLYTEAKEIEAKAEGARDALANTRAELASLRERRELARSGGPTEPDGPGEDDDEDSEIDWLSRSSIPVRKGEEWYERFRWFHTSDDFLVIGGRNADQNEELVKKYAERGDRFFHTQAPGAPATLLKATGPSEASKEIEFPETSLEQAAQFAVSYSSVWRDGHFAGDVYAVSPDQVSKTPESGEFVEKGSFVVRGERTYYEDTPVGVAVGIQCEPTTRVIGGPPAPITERAESSIRIEPGRYAVDDAAKRIYREFRERFADTTFVRRVASPDLIAHFLPPGGSRIVDE